MEIQLDDYNCIFKRTPVIRDLCREFSEMTQINRRNNYHSIVITLRQGKKLVRELSEETTLDQVVICEAFMANKITLLGRSVIIESDETKETTLEQLKKVQHLGRKK